ncbi:MAG: hypothetical protein IT165_32625 [Bryobacterales bacterium]|nr:hypothetical protein [Bryobacterales bacterium]
MFSAYETFGKVHNQKYTLSWSVSFNNGQDFNDFAKPTQQVFVSYDVARTPTPGIGITARRMDYVTKVAKGETTRVGVARKIVPWVATFPGFGGNPVYPGQPSTVWQNVDLGSQLSCLGLAIAAAHEMGQLGITTGYSLGFPVTSGGPNGTDATSEPLIPLPPDYQDSVSQQIYNYNLVYYDTWVTPPVPNGFEGYLYFNDDAGQQQAFTVAPASGPILPARTCTITPSSGENPLSFSVINRILLTFTGAGDPAPGQLYWLDQNPHINKAPRLGPFIFYRDGCTGDDLKPAPLLQ